MQCQVDFQRDEQYYCMHVAASSRSILLNYLTSIVQVRVNSNYCVNLYKITIKTLTSGILLIRLAFSVDFLRLDGNLSHCGLGKGNG